MKAITHFEVYAVKLGHWALQARLTGGEQERAMEIGRAHEADTGQPTQVIEEQLNPEHDTYDLRVLARYGAAPPDTQPPSMTTDISSRVFMVIINAFGIGAIITVIMAIMLSSVREAGAAGGAYSMLMLFTFAASALTAGLTLFKVYVPLELILWRNKGPESQQRAIEVLLYGTSSSGGIATQAQVEPSPPPPIDPQMFQSEPDAPPPPQMETNADQGEQTSFKIPEAAEMPPAETAPPPEAAESLVDSAGAVLNELLEKERTQLTSFADMSMTALTAAKPQLQSFERFGANLYFAGAAAALAERNGFPDTIRLELTQKILEHTGTNAAIAVPFVQRLETSIQRPRFRRLMEAGQAAMAAHMNGKGAAGQPSLLDLLQQWADPNARGSETRKVTFLLTDIVGSTALTSKVGNSGAQRVVRAHNTIARAAVKNFRGTEVKHTGDGMLLTFPDPASACRAAIDIQQEAFGYARDNPDAPLALRLGVHTGQCGFEDGEYYGPALSILNGVCAAADTGAIFASEEVKAKSSGPNLRFTDAGMKVLKGGQIEMPLFSLDWTPKPKAVSGPLEYRQIGARPAPQPAAPAKPEKPALEPQAQPAGQQ